MNYYDEIKNELINNEVTKKIKDYSKNKSDLDTYYNVGKLLIEAQGGEERARYGDNLIKDYSRRLTRELGKGYNTTSLKRMRKYYILIQKGATVWHQLSWSHYRQLLSLDKIEEINYYSEVAATNLYGVRKLQEIISNKEYERLPEKTKLRLSNKEKTTVQDYIKNPIIIKNTNNIKIIKEKALHKLILEDISNFLKELGSGFAFIDSEYKIKIGDDYHYIDILLFNVKYNSYVVVELKVTEFKVEYISQVQKYMNYIDKNVKEAFNNNTIGILICKKENNYVIEYCSDDRIAIRKYVLV